MVGDLQRPPGALLDQQHRDAVAPEHRDRRVDLVDHLRHQAERDLVDHQQPRLGHQRSPDRQHLLLAAGQRPRLLAEPLAEPRKQGEHALAAAPCASTRMRVAADLRSEEHTSELQSLMRISYAVFCLKKKKNITNTYTVPTILQ